MSDHMEELRTVVDEDVDHLVMKERTYGGSWKKRGGVGAFMMMARKWDRIENMITEVLNGGTPYDIFYQISRNPTGADGTMLAEVRDLRRYLTLIEAEMIAQGVVERPMRPSDVMKADRAVEMQEPFGYHETRPIKVRHHYMENHGGDLILSGSMSGLNWGGLYYRSNAKQEHEEPVYEMASNYIEEYGDPQ